MHDVRMVVAKHQRVVQLYHFHTSFGNISLGHDVNQDGHYKDGNAIYFFEDFHNDNLSLGTLVPNH